MAGRTAAGTATPICHTRPFRRSLPAAAALLLACGLAACSPNLSPNTYSANAVQQANKAERGVVIGVRQVDVRAAGTTGAVIGGAAGGIAGSEAGSGATSAFGALGGSVLGGLIGTGVEHASGDTQAFEYIVRQDNDQLVSVTQKDSVPLAIGQHVLVIAGAQARIVPDYTVAVPETKPAAKPKPDAKLPTPPAPAPVPAGGVPAAASGDSAAPAATPAASPGAPTDIATPPSSGDSGTTAPAEAPKDSAPKESAPADSSAGTPKDSSSILPSTTKLPDGSVTLPTDGPSSGGTAPASTSGSATDALDKTVAKSFTSPTASVPASAVPISGIPDVSADSVGAAADALVGGK